MFNLIVFNLFHVEHFPANDFLSFVCLSHAHTIYQSVFQSHTHKSSCFDVSALHYKSILQCPTMPLQCDIRRFAPFPVKLYYHLAKCLKIPFMPVIRLFTIHQIVSRFGVSSPLTIVHLFHTFIKGENVPGLYLFGVVLRQAVRLLC